MTTPTITRNKPIDLKKTCCHYWLIDPPEGPSSHGVCKLCGAEREFYNGPPQAAAAAKRGSGNDVSLP